MNMMGVSVPQPRVLSAALANEPTPKQQFALAMSALKPKGSWLALTEYAAKLSGDLLKEFAGKPVITQPATKISLLQGISPPLMDVAIGGHKLVRVPDVFDPANWTAWDGSEEVSLLQVNGVGTEFSRQFSSGEFQELYQKYLAVHAPPPSVAKDAPIPDLAKAKAPPRPKKPLRGFEVDEWETICFQRFEVDGVRFELRELHGREFLKFSINHDSDLGYKLARACAHLGPSKGPKCLWLMDVPHEDFVRAWTPMKVLRGKFFVGRVSDSVYTAQFGRKEVKSW